MALLSLEPRLDSVQIQTQPLGSSDLVVQVRSSSLFIPRQNSLLRLYLHLAGQLGV